MHGDRDGLGLPAGRARHRPLQQPGRRPRRADRDHGRLAARRGERQVERRAAGRACAPTSPSGSARCSCARRSRGDARQPAARRAGAGRVRARPAKRATLAELQPYLRQMHGALSVLGFPRAAQAISICEGLCWRRRAASTPRGDDIDWIAEGLSSVGFFLEPCRHGREPRTRRSRFSSAATRSATRPLPADDCAETSPRGGRSHCPPAAAAPAARRASTRSCSRSSWRKRGRCWQTIEKALPRCRAKPDDREALTTVRRAFHTLKGSGRMVGLDGPGRGGVGSRAGDEPAGSSRSAPATPALLELLDHRQRSFSEWIGDAARAGPEGSVDASSDRRARQAGQGRRRAGCGDRRHGDGLARPLRHLHQGSRRARGGAGSGVQPMARRRGPPRRRRISCAPRTRSRAPRAPPASPRSPTSRGRSSSGPFADETTDAADAETVQAAVAELRAMVEASASGERAGAGAACRSERAARAHRRAWRPARPRRGDAAGAPPARRDGREKRVMRDDIDEQLLPIFLEEAQQLVPRDRRRPARLEGEPGRRRRCSQSLRRALHTLKGSARMAGAIRLGELCHLMESRIEAALEAGEFTAELFERAGGAHGPPEPRRRAHARARGHRGGGAAAPRAAVACARGRSRQPRAEPPLPSAAAMLRVNADTLDHLINEAGEVAIARSRIEAELRAIKQSLSDLTESVARLRGQLREVEVQADSQMQSRLSVMDEKKGDFDPLEFDRYTRLQELTRLMAESLNDVDVDPAGPAQEPRRDRRRAAAAGAHQPRGAAGADAHARGAVRQPERAPLPHRAPDRRASSTRRPSSRSRAPRSSSTAACSSASARRSSTCCATRWRTASRRRRRAPRRASPRAARIAIALRQEGNEIALVVLRRRRRPRPRARCARKGARDAACCRPTASPPRPSSRSSSSPPASPPPRQVTRARRPRRRHGRGEERDHRDRRPRRHRHRARPGHHLHHLPAAHARGDAGGAGARRRRA